MSAWLILLGYMLGFAGTARIAYVRLDVINPHDPGGSALGALGFAGTWPVVLPICALWWVLRHTIFRETPRQRMERFARQKDELRQRAKELGLEYPDAG